MATTHESSFEITSWEETDLVEGEATSDGQEASWDVVSGSGTGELAGIEGKGLPRVVDCFTIL